MCIQKPGLARPSPHPDRPARSKEARSVSHRRPQRDSTTDNSDTAVAHVKHGEGGGGVPVYENVASPHDSVRAKTHRSIGARYYIAKFLTLSPPLSPPKKCKKSQPTNPTHCNGSCRVQANTRARQRQASKQASACAGATATATTKILVVGVALEPPGDTPDLSGALVHNLGGGGSHQVLADLVVNEDDHLGERW